MNMEHYEWTRLETWCMPLGEAGHIRIISTDDIWGNKKYHAELCLEGHAPINVVRNSDSFDNCAARAINETRVLLDKLATNYTAALEGFQKNFPAQQVIINTDKRKE